MFQEEVKKKSKITPGLLIIIGVFLMSIVVIINNSRFVENINDSTRILRENEQ
ncbi:hypothetical protein [uncultured Tyzzerella sp.]|uniref:hypothetical protein n=1 Tax=uncultured Tyzzerella sp. TaxID=2321398 RepID=UPI002942F93B|nr:hypothetical protein [uncultured Tyzzerella sp.]